MFVIRKLLFLVYFTKRTTRGSILCLSDILNRTWNFRYFLLITLSMACPISSKIRIELEMDERYVRELKEKSRFPKRLNTEIFPFWRRFWNVLHASRAIDCSASWSKHQDRFLSELRSGWKDSSEDYMPWRSVRVIDTLIIKRIRADDVSDAPSIC